MPSVYETPNLSFGLGPFPKASLYIHEKKSAQYLKMSQISNHRHLRVYSCSHLMDMKIKGRKVGQLL